MRMAWNPDIMCEELLEEAAGYPTSNEQDKQAIIDAIESTCVARGAFDAVCQSHPCEELAQIRDDLVIPTMIDHYARSAREVEDAVQGRDVAELMKVREARIIAVYQSLKEYPIYQGFDDRRHLGAMRRRYAPPPTDGDAGELHQQEGKLRVGRDTGCRRDSLSRFVEKT